MPRGQLEPSCLSCPRWHGQLCFPYPTAPHGKRLLRKRWAGQQNWLNCPPC